MNKENYRPRVADAVLEKKLKTSAAVVVQGPKWCGKTTTSEQFANSILYMADPETLKKNLLLAENDVKALLQGETPHLIDEWQEAPQLWDAIRFEADHRQGMGQFILTGSAVPVETDKMRHSGTGRFSWLTMRTMSLWESGESNGNISLEVLFGQPDSIFSDASLNLYDMAFLICRGGWPTSLFMEKEDALEPVFSYYEAVTGIDISRVDNTLRDEARAKRLLRSLARHQGTQVPNTTIRDDMKVNDTDSLTEDTVASYINALKKIFVVEDMEAWNPNLRSKSAIRTSDTRYFTDPSIAVAALGIGPKDLANDLNTMGLLFETLAVRDLRVYADALNGKVYHFRDKNGLECDAVVHLRNGHYGLIEIKLGGEKLIEEGAASLNRLETKIDTDKMFAPSFKMVLTAVGNMAYRRKDGVFVVPIGTLKR